MLTTTAPSRPGLVFHAYADLHRASPVERTALVRAGVTAEQLKRLIAALHLDQQSALDALSLRTVTVNRKAARGETLARRQRARAGPGAAGRPAGGDGGRWGRSTPWRARRR